MSDKNHNSIQFDSSAETGKDARLDLLYEIGRILASLETLHEAAPQILKAICQNLQFEIGELWLLDKNETALHLESCWHLPSPLFTLFIEKSRLFKFIKGDGMPGKSWAKREPFWVENVGDEDVMPRRHFFIAAGLRSSFTFPIMLGERFIGAFSFFSVKSRHPEPALMQMFAVVGNHIGQFAKREQTEGSLRASEDRYRAFIVQSTEGIWRFELDEKISTKIPIEQQVELAFKRGYLAECNDAMARMYGLERAEEMVGSRMLDLFDMSDAANVEYVRAFIESGYKLTNAESHEKDFNGNDKFFLNSLVGTIEDDFLIRVWGTQRDVTEQKIAERRLRESEENFRAFVQASSQAIWTTGAGKQNLEAFGWWETQTGQTREKSADEGFLQVIHPEDRERTKSVWHNALLTLKSFETECRIVNRGGEYKHFAIRGVPVFNADDSFRQWIGTLTDIHERKQAENRLALLSEISELTRNIKSTEDLLLKVSKAVGEHLEVKRCLFNEIDLAKDLEIVHQDYCCGVPSVAGEHRISDYSSTTSAEMVAGKTVVNNDSKVDSRTAENYAAAYEPNGERAYIAIPLLRRKQWVASLWVSDEKPREWSRQEISLLETIAERTWTAVERFRINVALRESEERYRNLFETMDEGFCLCEMIFDANDKPIDYRFLEMNPAFERMTGLLNAQNRTALELVPNLEKHWIERYGKVALTGETLRFEEGSEAMNRWFEVCASRVGDEQSRNFTILFNDITERKRMDVERERMLAVEQTAREVAEEANHAKDEFIALVSHELRSPLNAMLGWTHILQNQKPDEKTKDFALEVIVRNARSQSRLIEDLLDIARVGKGKLRVDMQPTELIPIINAAVEIVRPTAENNQIHFIQSLDRAANFITGDVDRLRQVVDNLLSNAVKFTPLGGRVEIRLEREADEAKIIVSDSGQGISPEFLPQIFERFKQADHSTTRRHGGLGIGLSLARDLVELHGGTITAKSAGENQGATFVITLPLRKIAPLGQYFDKVEFMNSQGKLSGFWILAVDDEADARELVSFMLQINGAKVTTANSAVEALEILKNAAGNLPDILLSDISMPYESGYALLEKVRALPPEYGGQIPAIALTAFSRPEDREAAFEAGFQKHLGKPVEPEDLISAIVETANTGKPA